MKWVHQTTTESKLCFLLFVCDEKCYVALNCTPLKDIVGN